MISFCFVVEASIIPIAEVATQFEKTDIITALNSLGDLDENVNYDEYGLQMETEHYEFSGTDEDGGSWNASGDYLKYLKFSLDSEKIDKLVEKYGVDKNDDTENPFIDLVPTMEIKDIKSNSVSIFPKVAVFEDVEENIPLCNIYRSTSKDGEYEAISQFQVSCNGNLGLTDEDLESGTTYWYKAKVVGGSNFSEAISVTTLAEGSTTTEEDNKTENSNENQIENPPTGNQYIFLTIFCLIISAISFTLMFRTNEE